MTYGVTNSARWAFNVASIHELTWRLTKSKWLRQYEAQLHRDTADLQHLIDAGKGNEQSPMLASDKLLLGVKT